MAFALSMHREHSRLLLTPGERHRHFPLTEQAKEAPLQVTPRSGPRTLARAGRTASRAPRLRENSTGAPEAPGLQSRHLRIPEAPLPPGTCVTRCPCRFAPPPSGLPLSWDEPRVTPPFPVSSATGTKVPDTLPDSLCGYPGFLRHYAAWSRSPSAANKDTHSTCQSLQYLLVTYTSQNEGGEPCMCRKDTGAQTWKLHFPEGGAAATKGLPGHPERSALFSKDVNLPCWYGRREN
jgi:hypothetical protein